MLLGDGWKRYAERANLGQTQARPAYPFDQHLGFRARLWRPQGYKDPVGKKCAVNSYANAVSFDDCRSTKRWYYAYLRWRLAK